MTAPRHGERDDTRVWEHPAGVWHWCSDYGFLCAHTYPTRDEAEAARQDYRKYLESLAGKEWSAP